MAMAQKLYLQHQINIGQYINIRLRLKIQRRKRSIWRESWLQPERRLSFGLYDELMVEPK